MTTTGKENTMNRTKSFLAVAVCVVPLLVCGCGDKATGDAAGDGKVDPNQSAKLKAGFAERTTDASKLTDAQKQQMAKYAHGAGPESRNAGAPASGGK